MLVSDGECAFPVYYVEANVVGFGVRRNLLTRFETDEDYVERPSLIKGLPDSLSLGKLY
jgi:hypothetical protein